MQNHDWSLTWIVTPNEMIETHFNQPQPGSLDWAKLRPEQLETIPILRKLEVQKGQGVQR